MSFLLPSSIRRLRLITSDENSSFKTLLQTTIDITVHQRNLQILMTEVYKIIKGEASAIMNNLFIFRENIHNIRIFQIVANEIFNFCSKLNFIKVKKFKE